MEQEVLRGPLWPVRAFRDLRSRTKHRDAPKTIAFTVERNGKEEEVELPLDEAPILFGFPLFTQPGYFSSNTYKKGIDVRGVATVGFGETRNEVLNRLGVTRISISQQHKYAEFARMIAKIAYCTAFADGTFSRLTARHPPVANAILGDSNDIGRYVGNIDDGGSANEGLLHHITLHTDTERGLLLGKVHLFADSQAPQYIVIIGSLRQEQRNAV